MMLLLISCEKEQDKVRVAVLMSSYNGEEYIREQIDSILDQHGVEIQLYVRDDGSKDSTVQILEEYETRYNNISFANKGQIENLGIKDSFLTLLELAVRDEKNDFFAFADQDDVWIEDKLDAAVKKLQKERTNPKGKLYYSNKRFVDRDLNTIREENIVFYDDFYEVLWRSLAFGCTMVFDRNLAQYCVRHRPANPIMHDSWIYHVAKCIGSTVVFDETPHILYRQHGDNSIGMEGAQLYHNSIFFWIKRFFPVLFMKRENWKVQFITEVYENYKNEIPDENEHIITMFLKYRRNIVSKYRLIHNTKMEKRSRRSRLVWAFMVIFNRL